MSPHVRRIFYVISYELVAIVLTTLILVVVGFGGGSSGLVAIISSTVAVTWNYIWTTMFEFWESRQASRTRTVRRRMVHSVGFEGGLVVFLVPILSWVLDIPLLEALRLQAGLLMFFLVYTFVFAWLFDRIWPRDGGHADHGQTHPAS